MTATLDDLLPSALTLSDESKLLLAEHLLESIPAQTDLDAALLEEVSRRQAEARANPSILLPGDDVLRAVRLAVESQSHSA